MHRLYGALGLALVVALLVLAPTARAERGCTASREDVISLIGYYSDDVWGPYFGASPEWMATVKRAIYNTVQRESGTNQCRSDGSYMVGDSGHSVGFSQLHDGYLNGYYVGSAWHNAENPYRYMGLDARYDPEVQAGFITWWAYRYGNLCPWWTNAASAWLCAKGGY